MTLWTLDLLQLLNTFNKISLWTDCSYLLFNRATLQFTDHEVRISSNTATVHLNKTQGEIISVKYFVDGFSPTIVILIYYSLESQLYSKFYAVAMYANSGLLTVLTEKLILTTCRPRWPVSEFVENVNDPTTLYISI